MVIHKIEDIVIYNTSTIFDKNSQIQSIEKGIAEWIVDHYESNIILDIINKNYEGFTERDKYEIINRAENILSKNRNIRETKIENCLKNYLKSENKINVEGFVRFRLKDYRKELEGIIDEAIDKYIVEKEYIEFIDLLREYVFSQKSIIDYIDVIIRNNDTLYFDKNGNDITSQLEKSFIFDLDLSNDDKLLTILVLTSPERIVIHNCKNDKNIELFQTIQAIFGELVSFCKSCNICEKFR